MSTRLEGKTDTSIKCNSRWELSQRSIGVNSVVETASINNLHMSQRVLEAVALSDLKLNRDSSVITLWARHLRTSGSIRRRGKIICPLPEVSRPALGLSSLLFGLAGA